jgi:GntR family transcriptional regulator
MTAVDRIDRTSPVPYYHQLRGILESALVSNRYQDGDRLPSEAQLCDAYGVSRTVVRQALGDLESEGLIVRVKGRGSFVAPSKTSERLVQTLSRVLRLERLPAPPHLLNVLALAPGEEIVLLERLRLVDAEPWVLTTTYLPASICSEILGLDMTDRSLYATLEDDLGLELATGTRTVEAAVAGPDLGAQLAVEEGAPLLCLRSITYLADGRPVEYFVAWHRGDRSRFEVILERNASRPRAITPALAGVYEESSP